MANSTVHASSSLFDGGGVYLQLSQLTAVDSMFSQLTADLGGGAFVDSFSSASFHGCLLVNNSAGFLGGGLFVNRLGTVTISSTRLAGNVAAADGGGVFLTDSTGVTVHDTLLDDNTAAARGGGMVIQQRSRATLARVSFRANTARDGGGLYIASDSTAVAGAVSFVANAAAATGGAVALGSPRSASATALLADRIVASGNVARGGGGTFQFAVRCGVSTR